MRLVRFLAGLHRASVEAGSTAIDANKDTRRRRGWRVTRGPIPFRANGPLQFGAKTQPTVFANMPTDT